jgi:PknH-like extracellular domain
VPTRTTAPNIVGTTAKLSCVVTLALAGCGHSGTGAMASPSHAAPAITADGLLVGLDDVRRIVNVSTLTPAPGPNPNHQPSHFDNHLPPACDAVFDQRTAFDGNWTQFASTTDAATVDHGAGRAGSIADIGQAVAVYADESTAQSTFSQLKTKLVACRALGVRNYDYTIDDADSSSAVLSTSGWTVVYRVKSAVMLTVSALGVDDAEPAARTLATTISDRIH